ncbi:hypothetical protein MARI_32820 [Marinobacter sp. JH2]|nr:hypothetical protein [Marinobacter sp. JH2]QBM19139.1 hypothetical protein MARI_32820 [Marinobacter sp. JH2]
MAGPSDVLALLQIIDWFKEKFGAKKDSPVQRFVDVFESHGVHRNQIPRYFPDLLNLADVQDDQSLSKILDQEMIDRTADLFNVDTAWIECANSHPYLTHSFYKQPEKFIEFLDGLLASGSDLTGVLFTSAFPGSGHHADTFILIEESFEFAPDLPITRYHILDNWFFNYGKSRAYLAACVSSAWKRNVYIHGRRISKEFVRKYQFGENLLGSDITDHWPGSHWYPEDMALDPRKLIDGLPSPHEKNIALEVFSSLCNKDKRFCLDEQESIHKGESFLGILKSLKVGG